MYGHGINDKARQPWQWGQWKSFLRGDGGVMMKTSQEEESLELLVLFAIFVCICCIFSFSQEVSQFHRSLTRFWKMLKTANLINPWNSACGWEVLEAEAKSVMFSKDSDKATCPGVFLGGPQNPPRWW